jgi:hypothetical protein
LNTDCETGRMEIARSHKGPPTAGSQLETVQILLVRERLHRVTY